jgi:hypothetical protein
VADIRSRFMGGIERFETAIEPVGFDLSAFVQRLLLFDHLILDSFRLREFPSLLETFGYESVITLLSREAFSILCDSVFIAQAESDTVLLVREGTGNVRVGPFHYGLGRIAYREKMIDKEMMALDVIPGLTGRQVTELKAAISSKLRAYEENAGHASLDQLESDLENNVPSIALSVAKAVERKITRPMDPTAFSIRVVCSEPSEFYVLTNLPSVCELNDRLTISTIGSGLLAMAGLNQRVEKMKSFNAMTGMRADELPLLSERLSFLEKQIDPDLQVHRFHRVLELSGFPNLNESSIAKFDLEKLFEIRESRECKEFRSWLWAADALTDEEIRDQFTGLSKKMSLWAHGNIGKSLRWSASTGIGFIPVVGNIAGAALGLLDTFLLEKVLPESGPVTFLNRYYPSLFRE